MDQRVVTFLKTNEEFGGLSNMAGGYPFMINGERIKTSEHLYQALKYPDSPEIQKEILDCPSPIGAKMIAKKKVHRMHMRPDWAQIQLEVMAYCLRAKLIWNWVSFGKLLRRTGEYRIVEISSKKDKFWGAVAEDGQLKGDNHLGELLGALRDAFVSPDNTSLRVLEAPANLGLRVLGKPIEPIDRSHHLLQSGSSTSQKVATIRP
jgi:type I restriction enzyme, S subunit